MPTVSAINLAPHPDGGWTVGVVGKRTYTVAGGACVEAREQLALIAGPVVGEDRALLAHDTDLILNRTHADVIVEGHAYAPHGAASFDASVQAGTVTRALRVHGERRCELDPRGKIRFTPPAPLAKVPLAWTSAYGGPDRAALERHGDALADVFRAMGRPPDPRFGLASYPRNPFGRGYLLEATPAGLAACMLPLIEDPAHLLTPENLARVHPTLWPAAPLPAGTSWLSYNMFPRTVQLGIPVIPYDVARFPPASFAEVQAGWVKPDSLVPDLPPSRRLDPRVVQSAAPGMRGEVRPGDAVRLVNLHPREAAWSFTLPARPPEMILRLPGDEPVTLAPAIRSLVIRPDEDRVAIVWVGEHRISLPLSRERFDQTKHAVIWKG